LSNAAPLGFFSLSVTYTDSYLTSSIGPLPLLTLTIVQRPAITAIGAAYKFQNFDPLEKSPTYFDEYFPMVQKF
jgi:hypothetical protein